MIARRNGFMGTRRPWILSDGGYMKLLTKEIARRLPVLGSQETVKDPMIQAKWFDPCGSWTWYAIEKDPASGQCFGLVHGHEEELGYFDLDELQAYRGRLGLGIERDIHFMPCPLSTVRRAP
jgi:hypothetical protein